MRTNLVYAIRNILKNATNSVISVVGLAIAVACCLWIYFFVSQEHSYNNFYKNAGRIFRINYELKYIDETEQDVRVEPEIADLLVQNVPQIEKSTEYRFAFKHVLKHENEFFDTEMGYADREFFDIFSFQVIAGDQNEFFRNPDEIIITRELADKLMRKDKTDYSVLIGQGVEFPLNYNNRQFHITGILENLPPNSSFRRFEGIIPGENGRNFGGCDNSLGYTSIYYLVKENANIHDAEKNTIDQVKAYYDNRIQQLINNNELIDVPDAFNPFVLSMKDVYFKNEIITCSEIASSHNNSVILISIGIIILLIACSNYTLLSLGQAIKKMGEVGIRKAMGARKSNIFSVFFSEGLVLTFMAFILGSILCSFFLQNVNRIAEIEIYTHLIKKTGIVIFVIISFLMIVLFTSTIPVLIFSNINPNQLVTKKLTTGRKGVFSQLFVSFQYSLSIILIIITICIVRQANYLKNKSIGVSSENIVDLRIDRVEGDQKILLRSLIEEHPGIIDLTLSSRNFMNGSSNNYVNKGNGEQILVFRFRVDENYIPTLGLQLIHGKNFSFRNIKACDQSIVVNSAFIEAFGIEDNPIGRTYNIGGTDFSIIGVVDDYYYQDCKRVLKPAMLFTRLNYGNDYNNLLIKFRPEQLSDVMEHVKKCYRKVAPGKSFEYTFWDEELGKRYEEEERWSKIVGLASIIAILISSLGLFGLTILLINQRIKEIGIRKVNGARSTDVLITINKTFVIWLLASILIATPIAYSIVKLWLRDYPYKAVISWWIFILAGAIALSIALITVSWQSWRAATRNPVDSLRYE